MDPNDQLEVKRDEESDDKQPSDVSLADTEHMSLTRANSSPLVLGEENNKNGSEPRIDDSNNDKLNSDEGSEECQSPPPYTSVELSDSKTSKGNTLKMSNFKNRQEDGQQNVLMTGWATKESGQTNFGRHNWRKRWFVLAMNSGNLVFSYYRKTTSSTPRGYVCLTSEYSARELETGTKEKDNCFALGPAVDKSALRTYYICCETDDDRLKWITMINSAIEGVPEKALKRHSTYRIKKRHRVLKRSISDPSKAYAAANSYVLISWRISQWSQVCDKARKTEWKRHETKDAITICRQSFQDSELVVVKVEGVIEAPVDVAYEFLQRSVKPGGKFDFVFRKEELIHKVEDKCSTAYITRNVYNVPLPGMKKRDLCLLRTWIPPTITKDKTCGLLLLSVIHPQVPKHKEYERATLHPSGIVLQASDKDGNEESTRLTAIFQVDLKDALQNMLRGSYKSGVFRTGIRNFFIHLRRHVQSYYELVRV